MQPQANNLQQYDQELFSNVRRSINTLKEKQVAKRKNALGELLKIVKNQSLPTYLFEEITYMALKEIIKCYYDYAESNREASITLTIQLLSRCKNINFSLPYIMEALKDRTNCVDLEGIDKLPQKLRPNPGQKPKVMLKIMENCQQIRILYCQLIKRIILLLDKDRNQMVKHLDDMVNIQRALLMDPAPQIQKTACQTLQIFCKDYSDILLHFTENMGRAILLPLISKKSKIRIAALNSLTSILWCGLWKYNAFVFQNLIGFRDPNSVPIKDFFEPSNNVNYLATFITDPNVRVRQQFMKHIKIWVCQLNDKFDHHDKIVPYLLSGLSDDDETVQNIAYQTIVQIGKQIQEQRQKQFRENKQFAIDAKWTWDGKLVNLPIDEPLKGRPSLGSRFFVRGHVRKMWTAIYKQVRDIKEEHRIRAAKLAVYGAIFTENYLTQFLDNMIPQLLPSILPISPQDQNVSDKIAKIFYYIGRYCQQSGYIHLIQAALDGKLIQNQQFVRCAMKGLSMLIKGSLEAIPQDQTLCHKKDDIIKLLRVLEECKIAGDVYNFNCTQARDIAVSLFQGIQKKASEDQKKQILQEHFLNILKLLSVSEYEALYSNGFSLKKSQLTEIDTSQRFIKFVDIMDRLIKIYPDALDQLQHYLENIFCDPPSLMDSDWKIIVILHRYLCWKGQGNQILGNLFLLTQDSICQCLVQNRSVDLLAFTTKYIYNLSLINEHSNHNLLNESSKLLRECLRNLSLFKPTKKVPIYDQHLVKEDPDPNVRKISQQNYISIFKCCSQAFANYSVNQIQLPKQDTAGLIYYYIRKALQRIRKSNDCIHLSVKTIWAVFEKIGEVDQKLPHQLIWVEEDKQKTPIIPIVIDFCVERLEQYLQISMNRMVFDTMEKIAKCWPKMITMTEKIPNVYPAFLDLLQKLFKYTLNEKQVENKQKYMALLSSLAKKMPSWFKTEARIAQESKKYEKHRLIQEIMKEANI